MSTTVKPMIVQHSEHKEWLNKLSFYKDDLNVMQNRLDEIAGKNTSNDVMALVDQFQNKLKIQHELIDIMNHDINEHEKTIQKSIIKNPVSSDHRKIEDHAEQRDKIKRFEELFAELRKDLMEFLAKWM